MKIKEISDFIVSFEKTVPVNEIKYRKIHLWPIIRGYIYGSLLFDDQNQKPSTPEKKDGTWLSRFKSKIFHQKIAIKEVHKQNFEDKTDFLFWSRNIDHSDKVDGLPYSRHTDPYFELFNEQFKCRKLEIGPKIKRKVKTIFFPEWITQSPSANKVSLDYKSKKILKEINKVFFTLSNKKISYSYITDKINKVLHTSRIFKEILKKISPNAVFVVCYHDEKTSAVLLACRELNIDTIEIQHGQQGIYNSLYCRWTNIPTEGYSLLPKFSWMWGEQAKLNLLSKRSGICKFPLPFVGGNQWIAKFKNESRNNTILKNQNYIIKNRVITIATQPKNNVEAIIPEFVFNTIRENSNDFTWLIRIHPNQLYQTQEIINVFERKVGKSKVFIGDIIEYSLYDLLEITTFLISEWSSVIYESQVFGNIPIVVSEIGESLFSQKIKDGYFLCAKNKLDLTKIIHSDITITKDPKPFISYDDQTTQNAINQVTSLAEL